MSSMDQDGSAPDAVPPGEASVSLFAGGELTEKITGLLENQGFVVRNHPPDALLENPSALLGSRVAVVEEGSWLSAIGDGHRFHERQARAGAQVLVILDAATEPEALGEGLDAADAWLRAPSLAFELIPRVRQLLRKGSSFPKGDTAAPSGRNGAWKPDLSLDSDFLGLLVHDVRTPLNVISLSLRLLSQSVGDDDPDAAADFRLIEQNVKKVERMLAQLCDYMRLFNGDVSVEMLEFNPVGLVEELLETSPMMRPGVVFERDPSSPSKVVLDRGLARLALDYGLANAVSASEGKPVRVRLKQEEARCRVEIVVDQPPPSTVHSSTLSPMEFERFLSNPRERRGLDLAIVAKVCERLGGAARLDVQTDRSSALVIDWPIQPP